MLYFSYGSNLNKADLARFCLAHDYRSDWLKPVTVAYLPDMSLAFNYYSHSRQGGVLNVVEHCGQYVAGVIYDVSEPGWQLLDHKEGAPFCYQRCQRVALTNDGKEVAVVVYEVRPKRREIFVAPATDYLNVVAAGLAHYQLDAAALQAAANNDLDFSLIDSLFVDRQLMINDHYQSMLEAVELVSQQPAESCDIKGQLVRVRELSLILPELDRLNRFLGFGCGDSTSRRVLINVDTGNGCQQRSWSYLSSSTK